MAQISKAGTVEIHTPDGATISFRVELGDSIVCESPSTACPECNGTGWMVTGQLYCTCQMGRDLIAAERGKSVSAKLPGGIAGILGEIKRRYDV
jgi:hypothetical protein